MSNTQATYQDADLLLKLYDLRREPVMREATNVLCAIHAAIRRRHTDNHAHLGVEGRRLHTPGIRILGAWLLRW